MAVPAAWGFAVYPVKGSKMLLAFYVVLMLMPFQVTMLSSYLILNSLSLLNTHQAVILPAVFSAFPVFLCYGSFRGIPPQMLEAARMDGAGEIALFVRIGIPLGKNGLISSVVLVGMEYWNLFEQPMVFMIICTLVSKSVYAYQLPRVSTCQPESKYIEHKVEAEGMVVAGGEKAVTYLPGLRIDSVLVQAGDKVEEGDVLFQIDLEDLKELIGEKKNERNMVSLRINAILENQEIMDSQGVVTAPFRTICQGHNERY